MEKINAVKSMALKLGLLIDDDDLLEKKINQIELEKKKNLRYEHAELFLKFIKKIKFIEDDGILYESLIPRENILSLDLKNISTFRHIYCELFYQALNALNVTVSEYIITSKNSKHTVDLVFGLSEDCMDDNYELSVVRVIGPEQRSKLSRANIYSMYLANRTEHCDQFLVSMFISYLYNGGEEPKITTRYIPYKTNSKW